MNENDNDSENALVENLARHMLGKALLGKNFFGKLEKITYKFIISIPAFISFKKVRHKVSVADELHPGETEIRIAYRINLVELPCQNKVEGYNFVTIEIVLSSGSITNQVEEKFEERPLVAVLVFFVEDAIEYVHDCLNCVIQENI